MKSNPWMIHPDESPLVSPDGKKQFQFKHAEEIRMGSPLGGICELKIEEQAYPLKGNYGSPAIWSDCSAYLAIPYWTHNYKQRIALVDIEAGKIRLSKNEYRVLEFKSFKDKVLRGINSPIHMPEEIEVEVSKFPLYNSLKFR